MLSNHKTLEELIEISSQIKNSVTHISSLFENISKIIDLEHAAIEKSDLKKVEEICAQKLDIADSFENCVINLKNATKKLEFITEKFNFLEPVRITNLSECVGVLKKLASVINTQGMFTQVFNHVVNNLEQSIKKLIDIKTKIQPKIEKNKYVLSKVLYNRQENYRFWQEVTAELMSSYDKSGYQKAKKVNSIIQVKT